jgi:hypothetical protein
MASPQVETPTLPVPVLQYPHWRVHFQPDRYEEDRIPSLAKCAELVQQCKVSLRGWDFPHLSHRENQRGFGANYLASWSTFMGSIEYWRLFQSAQFLHLNAIEEIVRPEWKQTLEETARSQLRRLAIDWDSVPGYVSLMNFFYRIMEIFEFAARLSEKAVFDHQLEITVQLKGVRGFLLTPDANRSWSEMRAADTDEVGRSWKIAVPALIAGSSELSLKAALWFFERFHWLNPPLEMLRQEQATFLRGLV